MAGIIEDCWYATGDHPYRQITVPNEGWIISVDYPSSLEVMQRLFFETMPPSSIKRWYPADKICILHNGSTVGFKSCVAGDTRILMSTGIWKRIDEVTVGEEVISSNTYGVRAFKNRTRVIKDIVSFDNKECLKITTSLGYNISCTLDHKIYTNGKWTEAGNLKIGDKLVVYNDNMAGETNVEKWKPAVLGSLISDGCLVAETILWSEPDKNSRDELIKYLPADIRIVPVDEKIGINYRISNPNGKTKNPIKDYLNSVGLMGLKSGEKFIPNEVFRFNKECLKIFVRHLFNGDGWVSSGEIGYSTISKKLAEDLRLLLTSLGIKSGVYCVKKNSGFKSKNNSYRVIIRASKDKKKFFDFIEYLPKYELKQNLRFRNSGGNKRNWDKFVIVKKIESIGNHKVYDVVIDNPKSFYANGLLVFDCDSGWQKFQGAGKRWVHFDEIPDKLVYNEVMARQMSTIPLDIWLTMTPLQGLDFTFEELYEPWLNGERDDVEVVNASIHDNTYLSKEVVERLLKQFKGTDDEKARLYGNYTSKSGLLFKMFDRESHLVDPFDTYITEKWTVIRAIDPHPRIPFHVLWMAIDPHDNMYLIKELVAPEGATVKDVSRIIKAESVGMNVAYTVIDPAAKTNEPTFGTNVMQQFMANGIPCREANRGFDAGYQLCVEALQGEQITNKITGEMETYFPFKVFSNMKEFIYEIEHGVWDEFVNSEKYDAKERPKKKRICMLSLWRYLMMSKPHYCPMVDKPRKKFGGDKMTGY